MHHCQVQAQSVGRSVVGRSVSVPTQPLADQPLLCRRAWCWFRCKPRGCQEAPAWHAVRSPQGKTAVRCGALPALLLHAGADIIMHRYLWMQMHAKHSAAAKTLRGLHNQITAVPKRKNAVQKLWQQFGKARREWENCVKSYNAWADRHDPADFLGQEVVKLDTDKFLRFTRVTVTSDRWLVLPEFDGSTWPWRDCNIVDNGLAFIAKTELLKADQHHKRAREDVCLCHEEIVDCHHTVSSILGELAVHRAGRTMKPDVDPHVAHGWREGVCREQKRWSDVMRGFGAWDMQAMRAHCGL